MVLVWRALRSRPRPRAYASGLAMVAGQSCIAGLQGVSARFPFPRLLGAFRLYVFAHNERPSSQNGACAARGARVPRRSRRHSTRVCLPLRGWHTICTCRRERANGQETSEVSWWDTSERTATRAPRGAVVQGVRLRIMPLRSCVAGSDRTHRAVPLMETPATLPLTIFLV